MEDISINCDTNRGLKVLIRSLGIACLIEVWTDIVIVQIDKTFGEKKKFVFLRVQNEFAHSRSPYN